MDFYQLPYYRKVLLCINDILPIKETLIYNKVTNINTIPHKHRT